MDIKHINEVKAVEVSAGERATKQVLIGSNEAPHFALRRFEIQPGGSMPLHTNTVEHEQYVLNGEAHVQIGDKTHLVKKDSAVFIPAGVRHSYEVVGNEPFVFVCIVPNKEDIIEVVEQSDL